MVVSTFYTKVGNVDTTPFAHLTSKWKVFWNQRVSTTRNNGHIAGLSSVGIEM